MVHLTRFFKKTLISRGGAGDAAMEDGGQDLPSVSGRETSDGLDLVSDASAKPPRSSLRYALAFAGRFMQWCGDNEIVGRVDWPRLLLLADEFAEYENRRRVTPMALAKALARLGIEKSWRPILPHERGVVSYERSQAQHPRVTVYIIPEKSELHKPAGSQLRLFG